MPEIRVRFPPSPTGIPHLGNTRTALYNYLFAKHNNGKFILRIEDTDRTRLVPHAESAIKEILTWLGLFWDEFYKQSERLRLYQEASNELLEKGLARKDDEAVRFIVPKGRIITWEDAIGNKKISFKSDDIEDFVILKSDGYPTYHLANVFDDHKMKISHVIRGDEWISSTPKHILLYESFGWKHPVFAHLPVILGSDRTKLSKRHGAESVLGLRDKGFLKEAIINFMALLGWNPGGDREIMSVFEMIKVFDVKDINTGSPVFDVKKLEWMNGEYIRKSKISNLKSQISNLLSGKVKDIDDKTLERLIELSRDRMKTLRDFENLALVWFENKNISLNSQERKAALKLLNIFSKAEQWIEASILDSLRQVIAAENIRMPVVYKIFTGQSQGLPLPSILELLGKEETLKKLKMRIEI
jgi:glutamyl-tRNA synthetase